MLHLKLLKHVLLGAVCACAAGVALGGPVKSVDLVRPDGVRHYLMAAPEHGAPGKHALVILLHGHQGTAAQVLGQKHIAAPLSVWLQIAEREKLVLIAPDGSKGSDGKSGWNDCRADAPNKAAGDDVGFIGAIIDKAVAEQDVDPARVYVMGMSNGGMMTFRLASEIGARLAGIATVGASMAARTLCGQPEHPLSTLIVAGTADKIVPYAGGEIVILMVRGRGTVIGVEQSVATWRALDQLADAPQRVELAHRDPADRTRAVRSLWGQDAHKLQVELLKIDNGGHTEPSSLKRLQWMYTMLFGAQNGDLEVAEEAWSFFKDKRAGLTP